MTKSTSVTEHFNNLIHNFRNSLLVDAKKNHRELAKIPTSEFTDSYNQVIIQLNAGNVLQNCRLVFDDVASSVLEEEIGRNNKGGQTNIYQRQVETLAVTRGEVNGTSRSGRKRRYTSDDGNCSVVCCEAALQMKAKEIWQICNDNKLKIIGIGSIMVKMHDVWFQNISDVRTREGFEQQSIVSRTIEDDLGCKKHRLLHIVQVIRVAVSSIRGLDTSVGNKEEDSCGRKLIRWPHKGYLNAFLISIVLSSKQHRLKIQDIKILEVFLSELGFTPTRVELDSRKKIKCLRTDNRGEYIGDEFNLFCKQEGIKRQFTTAYTPQQNGVAERMNRTLLERARAMLATASLGKSFWAEAVNTAWKKDKVQENEEGDSTTRETATIQMEKEFQSNDSFEIVPQHEVNETTESQAPTTRTSDRERRRPDASFWKEAMQEEIEALHKNKTWELVPLPGGRKPIGNKWVYKIKRNGDDQVERYRARLVVKGYAQKEGIDFNEIFSPVVRMTTVRVVLAMCATYDLHLEQLDVKTAFLHGNLEEEIYMLQPEGFEQKGKENLVCRLNKSLYGLKQAPRCWYKRFDSFIIGLGYNRLHADPCAYFKRFGNNDFVILLLYVDDMLVAGPNKDRISKLKAQLAREFEMKDLGPANKILGMQIHRDRVSRKIWLSQKSYVKKILQRFNMQDCKPISTPFPTNIKLSSKMSPSSEKERMEMSRVPYASAVGSLMFAMICTRPDIAHAVGVVSRYMAEPGKKHWEAVKRILRYIKGTSDVALCYGESGLTVKGYVDLDYVGDLDRSKSTTGYVFTLSGGIVSWVSKLQSVVAMSTTEAEYVAAAQASKEASMLKMLFGGTSSRTRENYSSMTTRSALYLARNPAVHSKT
ncbi:retrovirus-related pol polyprotein from transposon TNT 1-94 [Tanacetum coccineum]|uniref:Retrovirus-related pol polyprotein from transposon TNT 1-94 n=1 Tax=Tanacetum coccineum TaxID=301880 RepID=A0ABQ5EQL5_9ASTR